MSVLRIRSGPGDMLGVMSCIPLYGIDTSRCDDDDEAHSILTTSVTSYDVFYPFEFRDSQSAPYDYHAWIHLMVGDLVFCLVGR